MFHTYIWGYIGKEAMALGSIYVCEQVAIIVYWLVVLLDVILAIGVTYGGERGSPGVTFLKGLPATF